MPERGVLIDGKAIARAFREEIAGAVKNMERPPGLAVILVGDDPASHVYVASKGRACRRAGMESREIRLPAAASHDRVAAEISALNDDPAIDGILLQLPLPGHLDSGALIELIRPDKDVDGLTHANMGALVAGRPALVPCTPQGSLRLLKTVRGNLSGLHAAVIGRSLLFGKPMAQLLLAESCTVTHMHSRTKNPAALCAQADIVIAAAGVPGLVGPEWVGDGAIVIDVGINRLEDGSLTGDVDFEAVRPKAAAITPVPGGVGPMTIACLLNNTLIAARNRR